MNKLKFALLLVLAHALLPASTEGKVMATYQLGKTEIKLTDSSETASMLMQSDSYTRSFSSFDLASKTGIINGATEKDYLKLAAIESRTWSAAELISIKESIKGINDWCAKNKIALNLPSTIIIAKTTGMEELGSDGYTRNNIIVMAGQTNLHLVAHELFHVFSRFNPTLRDNLYAILKFKKCNPISYQQSLDGKTITNPDCPVIEHYIAMPKELLSEGSSGQQPATLILYSNRDYMGGGVFETYLKIGLLHLEETNGVYEPREKAVVTELTPLNSQKVAEYMGAYTGYLLHPEEICAEHFSMLLTGASTASLPSIVEMKKLLQKQ